jgi:TatD DNase family protein
MYIDIHSHTGYHKDTTIVVRNIFPDQVSEEGETRFFTIGAHPWFINNENQDSYMKIIGQEAVKDECIAIGETGLDKVAETPYELQIEVFEQHLEIARKLKKPVILHCVRSYNEMQKYRSKSNKQIPWIFHWFNASAEVANDLIRKNCYLSFGHMLYTENSKAYKLFPDIPLENVFFETDDAGYSIADIYAKAAELKQVSLSFLQEKILENFYRCFGIEL